MTRGRWKCNLTRALEPPASPLPAPPGAPCLERVPPGTPARPLAPPGRGMGGEELPKWAQLCQPRPNSPRRGGEPLLVTLRFPSSHPQTQSTSLLAAADPRSRPPPASPRTPSYPATRGRVAASRVAAAQYRGAARTIAAPQDRRRARVPARGESGRRGQPRPGPPVQPAPSLPTSAGFTGPSRTPPPSHLATLSRRSPDPQSRPDPLGPGRSRSPAPQPRRRKLPRVPSPEPLQPPAPQPHINGRR